MGLQQLVRQSIGLVVRRWYGVCVTGPQCPYEKPVSEPALQWHFSTVTACEMSCCPLQAITTTDQPNRYYIFCALTELCIFEIRYSILYAFTVIADVDV
jgi:hypothetical protein